MKTVIITGSSGLVGSEASRFFSQKNFRVIGIDNNLRKYFFGKDGDTNWVKRKLIYECKNYKHYNCDIRNKTRIKKIFQKYNSDIKLIIHAAGQPSHDWAIKEPYTDFSINALGTLNLLENTKIFSKKASFIFLSTNKVYGDNPNKFSFKEKTSRYEIIDDKYKKGFDESLNVDNCVHSLFGVSKLSADMIVQEYGKNLGLKTVCFRAGCITGPNQNGSSFHGFLSYLVKISLSKQKYSLIGHKGKQVRDNLHSKDLVKCFWEFFKKPRRGEIYNIGGGRFSNCSILEALNVLESLTNIKIKRKIIKTPRVGDHIWYISDLKKFKSHYPRWKQIYNTKKIISDLLSQY